MNSSSICCARCLISSYFDISLPISTTCYLLQCTTALRAPAPLATHPPVLYFRRDFEGVYTPAAERNAIGRERLYELPFLHAGNILYIPNTSLIREKDSSVSDISSRSGRKPLGGWDGGSCQNNAGSRRGTRHSACENKEREACTDTGSRPSQGVRTP